MLDNTVALLAARMIEAESRAGERVEARMKDAELPREERSTAKQQADHSRKKIEALQALIMAPMDYFALSRTPLEPFDVSDALDTTSKATTRQPGRGQNTDRMNLARAFAYQSGVITVCKRADVDDPALRGAVSRAAERLHVTAPIGRTEAALEEQFTGTFDQDPARFKQISKEPRRNFNFPIVRTKAHMAVVCDAGTDVSTDAMKPWAFGQMSLKAPNDPVPLLHRVAHDIGDLNARRGWAQALESAATANGVALRCQAHDDHFMVKFAPAEVTDLSADHLIIAANNVTIETADENSARSVADTSESKSPTPQKLKPAIGRIVGTNARMATWSRTDIPGLPWC